MLCIILLGGLSVEEKQYQPDKRLGCLFLGGKVIQKK